jgi:3,4-dihydroxy 2-butanone 4-phosphate synthase/GTP cyclohydrolase II
MSTLAVAAAAERLAAGELVLVGDEADEAVLIAAAADRITSESLSELHELGSGTVVLGMTESTIERLRLHGPAGRQGGESLRIGVAIDAAGHGGGWSLSERVHTMRVAASAASEPRDLVVPGHVLTAQIQERGAGVASAASELARIGGPTPTVALSVVLDGHGAVAQLSDALRGSRLRRLAHVSSAELRGHTVARATTELAAACELPTRDGRFRAIAFGPRDNAPATVALIHGEPAGRADPFVHVHVACRLGDAFGSLLCNCRAELDAATERILAEGCGVIVYAPSPDPAQMTCAHDLPIDAGVVSGLLRAAGVQTIESAPQSLQVVDGPADASLEAAA